MESETTIYRGAVEAHRKWLETNTLLHGGTII